MCDAVEQIRASDMSSLCLEKADFSLVAAFMLQPVLL